MAKKVTIDDMTFVKMIEKDILKQKVKELAERINDEYAGEFIEIIVVLKGAFIFASDLIRNLTVDHAIHFVQFSSYSGTKSTNEIKEKLSVNFDVKGKNILIIEDIIDTGNTLNYFIEKLRKKHPKSLQIAALLFKPNAFKHDFPVKFKAFDIDDKFVIGYGLDLDEKARHLKHIYQLEEE
ncbi:MAG TPA: hypoxanthine phosphoribosyltransferase [Saprospiraceae bacterium]|nr:hypoxanthine phosphoribosyltransferase [Saprospiraceae bacterium]